MNPGTKKPTPVDADVYICPCNAGFILSVGPVCLWMNRSTAEGVLSNLRDALFIDHASTVADTDDADADADADAN